MSGLPPPPLLTKSVSSSTVDSAGAPSRASRSRGLSSTGQSFSDSESAITRTDLARRGPESRRAQPDMLAISSAFDSVLRILSIKNSAASVVRISDKNRRNICNRSRFSLA